MAARLASALLVCVLSLSGTAHSQTPRIRIEYRAEASCPSAEEFEKAVLGRTTRSRLEADDPRTFVVLIENAPGGAIGSLAVKDENGTTVARKVEGANCADVAAALAFATALAIDPDARPLPEGDTTEASADDKSRAAAQGQRPPQDTPAPSPKRAAAEPSNTAEGVLDGGPAEVDRARGSLDIAFGPSLASGIAPRVSLGVAASLGWEAPPGAALSWLGFEVTALRALTTTVGTAASSFDFVYGRPTLCWFALALSARFRIMPCFAAELGVVIGEGSQIANASTETRFWGAAEVGARARLELAPAWFAQADASLVLPLTRYDFLFEDPNTPIYTVPSLAAAASAKLGWFF